MNERIKGMIDCRIADLLAANAVLVELPRDTLRDRERNDREVDFLRRMLEDDEDFHPNARLIGESWQADAEKEFGPLVTPICDCQNPRPASGAAGVSEDCPIHGDILGPTISTVT